MDLVEDPLHLTVRDARDDCAPRQIVRQGQVLGKGLRERLVELEHLFQPLHVDLMFESGSVRIRHGKLSKVAGCLKCRFQERFREGGFLILRTLDARVTVKEAIISLIK